VTETSNSVLIIDLGAHRSMRRRQSMTAAGQRQNASVDSFFGRSAMQLFWFWPTWVWVPMAMPATSAMQWDAL